MFGRNWPNGSGEEDLKLRQCIFTFSLLSLENGGALNFNKLQSSSPIDALCKVRLKLAQWFLKRR